MIEEHISQIWTPKGEFQDTLVDANGNIVWQTPWQRNLIVNGLRTVLAAGLFQGGAKPLTHWAVGAGKPTWDDNDASKISPDTERVGLTGLYQELIRQSLSGQVAFVDGNPSNKLQIKVDFQVSETTTIREFGLFAGGSNEPKSGILINHRIHSRIDLEKDFTLQRILQLTF